MISANDNYTKNNSTKQEIENCLRNAAKMVETGNREKAQTLYDHALALAPQNSTVFNSYGEFLEKENVFQAHKMYHSAIHHDPTNNKAISNLQRIKPIVAKLDQNRNENVERKKEILQCFVFKMESLWKCTNASKNNKLISSDNRETAADHNSSSEKTLKVNKDECQNKVIVKHIWSIENLPCPNFTLRIELGNITIIGIKNIHKHVLGYSNPQHAGKFRTDHVKVGTYTPPDYNEIEELMNEFENWLNSNKSLNLYSIEYAATAHYKLVEIHPFVDGNGRTARILMNFILTKHGLPAIPIKSHDSLKYYDHLTTANEGNLRPFIQFVADCVEGKQTSGVFGGLLRLLYERLRHFFGLVI